MAGQRDRGAARAAPPSPATCAAARAAACSSTSRAEPRPSRTRAGRPYCASKAAVDHATRVVAVEEADAGLRAFAVAPGVVDTDMQAAIRAAPADRFPPVERFLQMKRDDAFNSPAWVADHVLAWRSRTRADRRRGRPGARRARGAGDAPLPSGHADADRRRGRRAPRPHRRPGVHGRRGRRRARPGRRAGRDARPPRARPRRRAGRQRRSRAGARPASTTCWSTATCSPGCRCTRTCCPLVEGVLDPGCLLSSLSSIAIGPDETPQPIHADDQIIPLPKPHPAVVCNSMWALTDFTEANGATRLVPGSHRRRLARPVAALRLGPRRDGPGQRAGVARQPVARRRREHHRRAPGRPGLQLLRRATSASRRTSSSASPATIARGFDQRLARLCGYGVYSGLIGHIDKHDPIELLGDDPPAAWSGTCSDTPGPRFWRRSPPWWCATDAGTRATRSPSAGVGRGGDDPARPARGGR